MYKEHDTATLSRTVDAFIEEKKKNVQFQAKKLPARKRGAIAKVRISYPELLQILLNFQLVHHQQFLEHFISKFETVDTDYDGIINEEAFRNLCDEIDVPEQAEKCLEVIDPWGNDIITLSDCTSVFNSTFITPNMTVLQSLSNGPIS